MRRKLKGSQSMIQETILSWLPRGTHRNFIRLRLSWCYDQRSGVEFRTSLPAFVPDGTRQSRKPPSRRCCISSSDQPRDRRA